MGSHNGEAAAINGNNDKVQNINETFNINQQQISQQQFAGGNQGYFEARNGIQNTSGGCLPECSFGQGPEQFAGPPGGFGMQGCEGQQQSNNPLAGLLGGLPDPMSMLEGGGSGGGGSSPFGSNPLASLFGGGGGSDSSSGGSSGSGINMGEVAQVAGIVAAVC